ncbi:YoaK family protein [Acrocarpospora corrugata]|nr:YoaK family protein [Acrocarpospora corrugata]
MLKSAILTLTVVSGLVDAVSFLGLGSVFCSAITGNIVLLGLALGGASGFAVWPHFVALAAYVAGAVAGAFLGRAGPGWLRAALAVEAVLLASATVMAFAGVSAYALIVVLAFAMGIRNLTTRRLGVPNLTSTTVMTTTVTSMIAGLPLMGGHDPHVGRLAASVVALICGVVAGGWLVVHHGIAWPLAIGTVPVVLLAVIAIK